VVAELVAAMAEWGKGTIPPAFANPQGAKKKANTKAKSKAN
jgi:hypothetical protein